MADKIIDFQQRRQLEQAMDALADTQNERDLLAAVRHIAQAYPSDSVIPALVKRLDTQSGQLRGGLARLATLLPPDEIQPALRGAVNDSGASNHARLSAATILQRYLGQHVPPALVNRLSSTNDVVLQSLREAVEEGQRNEHVLLEYVSQLREESEEIAHGVLALFDQVEPTQRVPLLRLIAQDDRPAVARDALGRLATVDAREEAAAALHGLQFTLPPPLADEASRALRKLRFRGVEVATPEPTGWRALLNPVSALGNQTLLFLHRPAAVEGASADGQTMLLNVALNADAGLLQSYGVRDIPVEHLPSPRAVGELMSLTGAQGESQILLEAPFDFARWLLRHTLNHQYRRSDSVTLPGEYRLFNHEIWQFDAPAPDPALTALFEPPSDATQSQAAELATVETLLHHPVMASWPAQLRLYVEALGQLFGLDGEAPVEIQVARLVDGAEAWPEGERLLAAMARALPMQAAWLHVAGGAEVAQEAKRAAAWFARAPADNPLLRRLLAEALRGRV